MRRLAILPALALLGAAPPVFTDAMDDSARWPAGASDSVAASGRAVAGVEGRAVELNYDFGGVSGYAFVRRKADIALPPNFEVRFATRGGGGRNDLQFKLTDGDNVWWKVWRNRAPPGAWQEVAIPAGEISFAWGPASDHKLRHADGIEIVVARNRDGGAGAVAIDQLRIVSLPGVPAAPAVEDRANAELAALAKAAPRGAYPRAFLGEQPYWTLAGSD